MARKPKNPHLLLKKFSRKLYAPLYEGMLRIRRTEEKIAEVYPEQEIRCPTHLSIGQEAVAVGVCAALEADDHIYSTHRCHAHYLAKGGDLPAMMAELYGRRAGCAKGKGGSMHLVDPEVGMMGSSAIVGGSIPMAVGSALAFQLRGEERVAAAFFGDGATEEGVFHESLGFASLRKLPVLFVCENNFYATSSPLANRQPGDNIYARARAHLSRGFRVDGNDVLAVYLAARRAVKRARGGLGPTLIECRTYRWRDHVGPDFGIEAGYRTKEELEAWMERCPIKLFEDFLREGEVLPDSEMLRIAEKVEEEIANAFQFAKSSPFPEEADLTDHVY